MTEGIVKIGTFLAGLYFVLEFVLPDPFLGVSLSAYTQLVLQLVTCIGVLSIGLGLLSVLSVHGGKVVRASKGWFFSATLLASLFAMIFLQSLDWYRSSENQQRVERLNNLADFAKRIRADFEDGSNKSIGTRNLILLQAADSLAPDFVVSPELRSALLSVEQENVGEQSAFNQRLEKEIRERVPSLQQALDVQYKESYWRYAFRILYEGFFLQLGAAMFSLLGFYIAVAAYKAFRVRSIESGLMMAAAVLVILGQTSFGSLIWGGFPEVRSWLLEVPSKAAFRAIRIGAGVAALVLAFRIWCSLEGKVTGGAVRGDD